VNEAPAPTRILTLDLIRGVAVMGIFSVNVIAFAMVEAAYLNPAAYGGHSGIDLAVWATNMLLVDGKMRALFSMLFGASLLLVTDRAEERGGSPWTVHWRRMAVLGLVGLAHHFLLWDGDILFLYAVAGLIAFPSRNLPIERLVARGCVLLAVAMILFGAVTFATWQQDIAAHAPHATARAVAAWNDSASGFYPTRGDILIEQMRHLGPWTDLVAFKLSRWPSLITNTLAILPETLALMLLGMAAFRSGLFTGEWDDRAYRKLAIAGIGLGLAAHLATVVIDVSSHFYVPLLMATFFVAMAPFRIVMALGIAALVILATRRTGWFSARLAAVGRVAFSNYLGTSLIAAFIFDGWGLGYYDQLSRPQAWLVVPLVWLVMLAWSKPWLEHFHYGPLEWAWRSLSRGHLQPLRKA